MNFNVFCLSVILLNSGCGVTIKQFLFIKGFDVIVIVYLRSGLSLAWLGGITTK